MIMHFKFPLLDRVKLFGLSHFMILIFWVLRLCVFDAGKAEFIRQKINQQLTETRLSRMLDSWPIFWNNMFQWHLRLIIESNIFIGKKNNNYCELAKGLYTWYFFCPLFFNEIIIIMYYSDVLILNINKQNNVNLTI